VRAPLTWGNLGQRGSSRARVPGVGRAGGTVGALRGNRPGRCAVRCIPAGARPLRVSGLHQGRPSWLLLLYVASRPASVAPARSPWGGGRPPGAWRRRSLALLLHLHVQICGMKRSIGPLRPPGSRVRPQGMGRPPGSAICVRSRESEVIPEKIDHMET
jgi:hypothetical protein